MLTVATPVPEATTRFWAVNGVVEGTPEPEPGHAVLHVPPRQILVEETDEENVDVGTVILVVPVNVAA